MDERRFRRAYRRMVKNVKPLNEQSIGQRVVLTVIIVLIILLAISFIGWMSGRWDETPAQSLVLTLPPTKWDAEMLELEKQALREAYIDKMKSLFNVWVTSGLEDPQRPVKGAAQTRRAFIEIKKIHEMREQELEERQQK